ncbi:MAG: putative acetyltransferase [Parcubacteria group bacterium Gr01-1014_8]|nr:MAG: putative acetyltransferase [Parcubacteria group bacterium Gr01-1014_8]
MIIEQLRSATGEALSDINKLLKQLRDEGGNGVLSELEAVVNNDNTALIVAKDGERIVGIGTLYTIQKISKRSGHVEDVVVDDAYRGQGLGEKLMQFLLDVARKKHIKKVYLTTRPARIAANKLYQKLGFQRKETNVYSIEL